MRKTAVVTGASSGIGREFAVLLHKMGYHLIITGRNEKELLRLTYELGKKYVTAVSADLSLSSECLGLYKLSREYSTDVLINNAGFGVYGEFVSSDLYSEMKMLDVNVRAVHILTKLFLRSFVLKNHGYILNVASAAGFMPGPFMAGYYASKSYVTQLTAAAYAELRAKRSDVHISLLCPGPVRTSFNKRAGIQGAFSGITPERAAYEGLQGLFGKKAVIIPTAGMKFVCYAAAMLPKEWSACLNYCIQKLKKTL